MIYRNLEVLITRGQYAREEILRKMDVFLLANRITEEQYNTLLGLMHE